VILTTIRQLESGGRYNLGPNAAKASGAYQYVPGTWRNEGGYPHAYLAPSEIQDARARADVERFLSMYDGDVSMVPVMWYYPRAASDPKWMDRVPNPAGGNRLTVREYQIRWMERFARNAQDLLGTYVSVPDSPAAVSVLTGFPEPPDGAGFAHQRIGLAAAAVGAAAAATATSGSAFATRNADASPFVLDAVTVSDQTMEFAARAVPPEVTEEHGAGWMRPIVFPVLGPVVYANSWGDPRDGGERRHEGTDIIGVAMQPLLAAADGEISQLRLEAIGRSGVAISIRDADGWRYNYFHVNDDTPATDDGEADDGFRLAPGLELGDEVVAGQIIGYLGDSGNAEGSVPHLHFEFRDPGGRPAPSFWSLRAAEARQACTVGIGPWSTPALNPDVDLDTVDLAAADRVAPATTEAEPAVSHTIVAPMYGEGHWVIDSDGRVTATGDAALIMPSRTLECAPGPATPFGTDAAGWARFDHDALAGTVLEGSDLTGTVLETAHLVGSLESAGLTGILFDSLLLELSVVELHDPLLDPMVFTDPASGERIIVTFEPPPPEPNRLSTSSDRWAESLDTSSRRVAGLRT
jgi:murein DD-endopeptidase MepM/ murein hydrolase activator NlpD